MKKIFIDAYTRLNLGDDLFVKVLCERYPSSQFTIASHKEYATPFHAIKNLEVASIPRYIDGIMSKLNVDYRVSSSIKNKQAKKNDATVIIGGSIFIEPNNWQEHIKKNQNLVNQSNSTYILGSNFGPYQRKNFYEAYGELFSIVDDVCFRDESSYSKFKHLPTVRTAPDVVFSMDTEANATKSANLNDKSIVISVIDLSWREDLTEYQDEYEQSIIDISKSLIQKGYKVVLMSFCQYEGDEEAILRILHQAKDENLTSYFYNGDIEESMYILNKSSGIIATRFHSMIIGWIFNKPVFPFVYSNKTLNVLNDIEFEGYYLEIENIASINVKQVIAQTIASQPIDVSAKIKQSHENFLKLDQFIKE